MKDYAPRFMQVRHTIFFKKRAAIAVCGFLIAVFLIAVPAIPAFAQDQFGVEYGVNAGLSTRDVRETIVNIIRISLGILGVLALVLLMYGGVVWMTAGGNADRVATARKIILNAAIGLIIIFLAFAIVQFIFNTLQGRRTGPGISCTPFVCTRCDYQCTASGNGEVYNPVQCSSLCGGGGLPGGSSMSVSWASPRGSNVSLCTIVQFNVSSNATNGLDPASVNASTFKVTIADAIKGNGTSCSAASECRSGVCQSGACQGDTVSGSRTVIERVAEFLPAANWLDGTTYRVTVEGGASGIKSRPLTGGGTVLPLSSTYTWTFGTGNTSDTEPPQVIDASIYPHKGETDVCLATHLQAQFSEPMRVSTLLATGADPNSSGAENSLLLQPGIAGWRKDAPRNDWLDAQATPDPSNVNTTPLKANTSYTSVLDADVIEDACRNKLDGDRDGTAEGSSGGDDYDVSDPWRFTTGTTAQCTPEITSIAPVVARYDDPVGSELVITGRHFYGMGSVNFTSNVPVIPGDPTTVGSGTAACLDSRGVTPTFYPTRLCLDQAQWTPTSIRVRVPAGGGSSHGAVSGNVFVEVGNEDSNRQSLTVASPHINSGPSPRKGGRGQYITLSGAQFGGAAGKVFLKGVTTSGVEHEALPTDCAVSTWGDSQVVVKIPTATTLPLGFYYLQVADSAGRRSNFSPDAFEVTAEPPGPGLCEAVPACGITGTSVALSGVRFGTGGQVSFGGIAGTVGSGGWTDTSITALAPAGISAGNNPIVVQATGNPTPSNSLSFVSPCGSGAPCDSNPTTSQCDPGACGSLYQCSAAAGCTCVRRTGTGSDPHVIDRWPDCTAACLNSALGALFDQDMDSTSFSGTTVGFYGCPTGNTTCACTDSTTPCGNLTNLTSQTSIAFSTSRQMDMSLNQSLMSGRTYRVVIRGGGSGIKSSTGLDLGNVNFDSNADSVNDSYSWIFTTKNDSCAVNRIEVQPQNATVMMGSVSGYRSYAYASNQSCSSGSNRLNITSGFSWRSCAIPDKTGCSSSCASGTGIASVTPGATSNLATAQGVTAGDVFMCSLYQSMSDGGALTVQSRCQTNADCEKGGQCAGSTCIQTGSNAGECTPVILPSVQGGLSPTNGDIGTWVTVKGCYFGNSPGGAEFMGVGGSRVAARFPSQTNAQCASDEWTDSQIIIEAPDATTPDPTNPVDDAVDGPITITTRDSLSATSEMFDVNTTQYPGLCRLDPSRGPEGTSVKLSGKGFGATKAAGDAVIFSSGVAAIVYPSGGSCPLGGWSDASICAEVPAGAVTGDVIVDPAADPASNPKTFTVTTETGGEGSSCNANPDQTGQCMPQGICNENLYCSSTSCTCEIPPAPSVTRLYPDAVNNACRNAVLEVEFDQQIDIGSVASSTRPGLFISPSTPFTVSGSVIPQSTTDNPTSCTSFDGRGCSVLYLTPEDVLSANTPYTFGVVDYTDQRFGVRSVYGVRAQPREASFSASEICQIDFVTVTVTPPGKVKNSDLFTCAGRDNCPGDVDPGSGNQHHWLAQAKTRVTNPASNVTANYIWEENDPQSLYSLSGVVPSEKNITAVGSSSGSASFKVGAFDPGDVSGSATTTIAVVTNVCDVPWPGINPYENAAYNFSFWYCRDQKQEYACDNDSSKSCTLGGTECGTGQCVANTANDLPELKQPFNQQTNKNICNVYSGNAGAYCASAAQCIPGAACENGACNAKSTNAGTACSDDSVCTQRGACVPDLLQDSLMKLDVPPDSLLASDTIGLKIIKNSQHLSARQWFDVFGGEGGDTTTVNGYDAMKSGRTIYINAANESGGSLFMNVYLLSFCKPTINAQGGQDCAAVGGGGDIEKINNQLRANWQFNINVTDADALVKIRRDTKRIGDLGGIVTALEQYKATHGGMYPSLSAGSYLEGFTTSKWSSWDELLGMRLPDDPLNQWGSALPTAGSCVPPGSPEPENQCSVSAGVPSCCDDSQQLGIGGQCSAGACLLCPVGYATDSCWNEAEGKFYCPTGSHIYLYKYAATRPELYAALEYNPTQWGLTSVSANVCPGSSSCGCFNVRL